MRFIRNTILGFIDFFYPLFSRFFSKQTFRYLACGGGNTLLDIFLYFIFYNFILQKQPWVPLPDVRIAPHIAAFMAAFAITFPLGFFLSKYIVFIESEIKGRIQLFRYALLVCSCIVLNYIFLKLFVEVIHLYPTVAKIFTTAIVAAYSYYAQRRFTFKVQREIIIK